MKIKKLGHCCLVVETKGVRIMTDPGVYSTMQDEEKNIDIIVITHEHADHFHVESLKRVLVNNPSATIVTNSAVALLLDKEGIAYHVIEDGAGIVLRNIHIEGFGNVHAEIYASWNRVQNTGYFLDDRLFYPGDAFINPRKPVDILALPVAGPWMKISEAIDYAVLLAPKKVFPVHDAILKTPGLSHTLCQNVLPKLDIPFIPMVEGDQHDFS